MNIKRFTVPTLCLLLFLLSFTSVAHGDETILDEEFLLDESTPSYQWNFDLPAGDNITILIWSNGNIDFSIENGTDTLYERTSIITLEDVWAVPRNDTYVFRYSYVTAFTAVATTLESVIIPEFPTWTSMLLILIALTVAIVIYKRRLTKTSIH